MVIDSLAIGERIRDLRKRKRLSQERFAEEINRSTRTVSNIENGTVIPELQTIVDIAELCGCTIDMIIKGE